MAGILGKFFQISMLLTMLLLVINISLITFGASLTGDESLISGVVVQKIDTTSTTSSIIEQSSIEPTIPSGNIGGWSLIYEQMLDLSGPYQKVLGRIFDNIDPSSDSDSAEQTGDMIRGIIVLFSAFGLAYIPFALWSAFVGGGSP